jgi:hypothetical protein
MIQKLIIVLSSAVSLLRKLKLAVNGAGDHVYAHELFEGTIRAVDIEKWLEEVTDWEKGRSKTNPFVSKHTSE